MCERESYWRWKVKVKLYPNKKIHQNMTPFFRGLGAKISPLSLINLLLKNQKQAEHWHFSSDKIPAKTQKRWWMIGNTGGYLQKHVFLRNIDDFRILPIIIRYDDHDHIFIPSDGWRLSYDADEQPSCPGWHCSPQVPGAQVIIAQTRLAPGFQTFLALISSSVHFHMGHLQLRHHFYLIPFLSVQFHSRHLDVYQYCNWRHNYHV